jgi:CBS domain-containing protein
MGLWQNFHDEPVSRLAIREAVTLPPTETLREAIAKMREKKIGCTIIVDEQSKPIGMFTESRLTELLSRHGTSVLDNELRKHMTTDWPTVSLTDPVYRVVEAMQCDNIRFLRVVDENGVVAGLTGQKGLIEFVADHFPGQIMVQRIGGEAFPSEREGA